jgi:hypothetical protein
MICKKDKSFISLFRRTISKIDYLIKDYNNVDYEILQFKNEASLSEWTLFDESRVTYIGSLE